MSEASAVAQSSAQRAGLSFEQEYLSNPAFRQEMDAARDRLLARLSRFQEIVRDVQAKAAGSLGRTALWLGASPAAALQVVSSRLRLIGPTSAYSYNFAELSKDPEWQDAVAEDRRQAKELRSSGFEVKGDSVTLAEWIRIARVIERYNHPDVRTLDDLYEEACAFITRERIRNGLRPPIKKRRTKADSVVSKRKNEITAEAIALRASCVPWAEITKQLNAKYKTGFSAETLARYTREKKPEPS